MCRVERAALDVQTYDVKLFRDLFDDAFYISNLSLLYY